MTVLLLTVVPLEHLAYERMKQHPAADDACHLHVVCISSACADPPVQHHQLERDGAAAEDVICRRRRSERLAYDGMKHTPLLTMSSARADDQSTLPMTE